MCADEVDDEDEGQVCVILGPVSRVIKKRKVHPYRVSWLQDSGFSEKDSA